jgi:hypothetical protein
MREPPRHRVSRNTFRPALRTPRIGIGDTTLQHHPVRLEPLPDRVKAELIEAAERGQIRGREGSVVHVEVFRLDSVRTPILGRPRPSPGQRRTKPNYTLNCEEPVNIR